MTFRGFWGDKKPVIGMVHLKALPGSPRAALPLEQIYDLALRDAEALIEGGADGVHLYAMNDAKVVAAVYEGIKDLL